MRKKKPMPTFKHPKSVMNRKIPTMVGLLILIGALVAGLFLFSDGTGVFAPRATPQTTPKKYRITNLTDTSFTVSFYTDEATPGFVKYGTDSDKLDSQTSDDRDQLSGEIGEYRLHHVTLRGLEPATTYYYVLGTGSRAEFDNGGEPFQIKTAVEPDTPLPKANTVFGSVSTAGGTPAEGSIVYLSAEGMADMSSLVKSSGSWAIALSKARNAAGTDYAGITSETQLDLVVLGTKPDVVIRHQTTVAEAQPVPELSFGEDGSTQTASETGSASPTPTKALLATPSPTPANQVDLSTEEDGTATKSADSAREASISGRLQDLLAESAAAESTGSATLDLGVQETEESDPPVTTDKPKIKGTAKPGVDVKIQVHSDNQIESTVTANENGEFELDLEALKEGLEPGEHTVTYSYIDPDTGEEVTKTETFWVEDPNAVLAQAAQTGDNDYTDDSTTGSTSQTAEADGGVDDSSEADIPYGSGNPYPLSSPTPTSSVASGSSTPTPTTSTKGGTRSAQVATESSMYKSGSVGTTLALVLAGLFFIFAGSWSWWLAGVSEEE